MKKIGIIFSVLAFTFTISSCKTQKVAQDTEENTSTEVWEGGTMMVSGTISDVKQEKDGQTITLTNTKGITYTAIVSIPNLGENHAQYRKFEVGEKVSFVGNLYEGQRLIVREVLEMR